jgi:aspartate aminotransferase
MKISARARAISPSLTLALIAKTKALKAAGRDVVSFGAGEPDFPTPRNVRDAAVRALDAGHTKYTEESGIVELRRAIVGLYAKQWGLVYDASDALVTTGAKQAIYNALQALVDAGDEVLVPQPSWLSYPEMVKAASGVPVLVACPEDHCFKLRPETLSAACDAHPKARVLVFNGVSNPTGCVHSPEEMRALAEIAVARDLTVVSDEIYERMVYAGARTAPFASTHPGAKERTICVSGVSKTFSMTGWRIGYAVGPSAALAAMKTLQGQSTSNTCSIAQHAALEALTGDQAEIERMIAEFARRRDRMVAAVRAIPGIPVTAPDGAFYVFPRVDAYYGRRPGLAGSVALAEALLEEAGVAVVPGAPFGSDAHIRLSYACSAADIDKGMARLAGFFAKLGQPALGRST